jgi:hypothetical protein
MHWVSGQLPGGASTRDLRSGSAMAVFIQLAGNQLDTTFFWLLPVIRYPLDTVTRYDAPPAKHQAC